MDTEIEIYSAAEWLKVTTEIHDSLLDIEAKAAFGTAEHTKLFIDEMRKNNLV